MADVVVVFDFDRTLIDDDSDNWVVTKMGLTQLFNQLRSTLPWNSLMDRMMKELHSQGKTVEDIANCLRQCPLDCHVVAAIKSAHSLGCDLKIVSDANQFYIETIMEHHGLLGCFSEIYTNPTYVDEQGRLRILPYHDSTLSHHGCNLCPSNLCKGFVLDHVCTSVGCGKRRFIYLGDGRGDFCPTLKLRDCDFVMPRKNYPLWDRICSNPVLVKAKVQEWSRKIAGLEPVNFITCATPHLGSRGHKQVPVFCGFYTLEKVAARGSWLLGRTGKHLFLTDRNEGKPPLLLRMVSDSEDLKFLSALQSFRRRVVYANARFDHIVGWSTSSLRHPKELPKRRHLKRVDKYKHIVNVDTTKAATSQREVRSENIANKSETADMEEEMLRCLTTLSWERVDVNFSRSRQRFLAHSTIQVKTYCINSDGAEVIQHMIDNFLL